MALALKLRQFISSPFISLKKKATYKRIYVDQNGHKYIGTIEGRAVRYYGDGDISEEVEDLVKNKIYIGTEPPRNPHEGKLWIDLS